MKKALLTLIQGLLVNCIVFAGLQAQNCTFTNLRLTTQAQVNDFNSTCKNIKGDISIIGADITNLDPLKNIEFIDGKLTIQNNTTLPSLSALQKLKGVTHLLIYNNDLLTDLTGLEGLTSLSGSTHIRYNKGLISLKGLDNITSANILYITNNDLLASLSGLGKLETVTDLISIGSNKSLTTLEGLNSLTSVSRILIGENELLPDLTGLETLTSVSYQMYVSSNKTLTSFKGIDNLTYLSELYISDNLTTDLTGLESITYVKWLVIGESKILTSLTGLNNLVSATNFIIRDNNLLTDLSGLENLTTIGWLQVSRNLGLVSLSGLGPVADGQRIGSNERVAAELTIGGLVIADNTKLTTCAIAPVCNFVSNNVASISGNGTGCNSQSAVEIACSSLPVTLAQFTAVPEKQTTLLQWTTTKESNSAVFEIEHSADAKSWQKIGKHAAKGESNQLANYQWVHQTPGSGLNYYRLKMIDLDDSYAYSRIVDAEFSGFDQSAIFVYPNPVSDVLFIENNNEIAELQIVNAQGKTVYETKKVPSSGVSVKRLSTGLYQVHITRQTGFVQAAGLVIR